MPKPAEERAAVVVVNYGSHHLLERHLAPLTDSAPHLHTVVVDNFTTAVERKAVSELASTHGWTSLLLDANVGFGAGVNRAADLLPPDIELLVLLNPDAWLSADSLYRLLDYIAEHPRHLVAPHVRRPNGSTWSVGSDLVLATGEMRGWHRRPKDVSPTTYQPWLSGACLALTVSLWHDVGGFDDDYFLYWEDVDLSRRVLRAGGELAVLDAAVAVHDEGATHRASIETRSRSAVYYYYNARNRLLFAHKHLGPLEQRAWSRTAAAAGYRLLLQGGRRQLRHPSRTLWPVWRGVRDGRKFLRPPSH